MEDRLRGLIDRKVAYTVQGEEGIFHGSVDRDGSGRYYIEGDDGAIMYDTGALLSVEEQ